jgi:hypothetical protein
MPNLDDFDDLLRQASAHGIRVLLTLHAPGNATELSGLARFWLNRGVAGLRIVSPSGSSPEQAKAITDSARKLAAAAAGQRIILSDLDLAPRDPFASSKSHRAAGRAAQTSGSSVSQLQIDTRAISLPTFDAINLRPILSQALPQPNLLLDLRAPNSAPLSEAVAAMTLLTQPAALIDSTANLVLELTVNQPAIFEEPAKPVPPPLPPQAPPGTYLPYTPYVPPPRPHVATPPEPAPADPLTNWYRQLASLHHDDPVLRSGSTTFLDYDAQNALVWVSKPAPSAPRLSAPVVVICNLSSSPLQLSLADAMKGLKLHGFFLRTLLRTDHAMGAQDINSVSIPALGVYIGELHR